METIRLYESYTISGLAGLFYPYTSSGGCPIGCFFLQVLQMIPNNSVENVFKPNIFLINYQNNKILGTTIIN